MRRRKRRKQIKKIKGLNNMSTIIITTIVMINLAGISYAYWNNGLDMKTLVYTGNIEPYFKDDYEIKGSNDKVEGQITVNFKDEYTMKIEGTVNPGYEGEVYYGIGNRGTIPVKCKPVSDPTCEGVSLTVNQPDQDLDPDENRNNSKYECKLKINANNIGKNKFKYQLTFDQWNQ
ncbi:MAG: hypothetical protein N4A64_13600 [Marinisporobacter sp.]|nr:hypothetical protein [Marinisporobacter sp.]